MYDALAMSFREVRLLAWAAARWPELLLVLAWVPAGTDPRRGGAREDGATEESLERGS